MSKGIERESQVLRDNREERANEREREQGEIHIGIP